MMLRSYDELKSFGTECAERLGAQKKHILVCAGAGCIASGSLAVYEEFRKVLDERGIKVDLSLREHIDHSDEIGLKKSGCHGLCELGPLVRIEPAGILYIKCKPEDCADIVEKSILGDSVVSRLVYHENDRSYNRQEDIPFYKQ